MAQNQKEKSMRTNSFRFMFLRGDNNFPVGCLAMRTGKTHVDYQVSTLNPSDKFDRKVARQLALGRLIETPIRVSVETSGANEHFYQVMNHVSKNKKLPKRSRSAANRWLSKTN